MKNTRITYTRHMTAPYEFNTTEAQEVNEFIEREMERRCEGLQQAITWFVINMINNRKEGAMAKKPVKKKTKKTTKKKK